MSFDGGSQDPHYSVHQGPPHSEIVYKGLLLTGAGVVYASLLVPFSTPGPSRYVGEGRPPLLVGWIRSHPPKGQEKTTGFVEEEMCSETGPPQSSLYRWHSGVWGRSDRPVLRDHETAHTVALWRILRSRRRCCPRRTFLRRRWTLREAIVK